MAAAGGKIQPRRHLHRPGGLPYSRKPEQHQRQSGIFGQLTAALGSIVPYIKNLFVAPQQEPGRYLRLKTRPPLPPAPKTCMDLQERKDPPVPEPTITSGGEGFPSSTLCPDDPVRQSAVIQEPVSIRTGSGIFYSEKSWIREVQLQLHIGNPEIPRSLAAREIITLHTCASGGGSSP
ncbi:hypothetical protein GDO81_018300 [Engystomops pustulosus]|uniref:Uncharacterized protein n=1 Tax=Engystomops pustulosus TaxID=76066 RepID=A0AAV7A5Y9_ENGPU|nr:hypothetical protein GDO81_018300 [Engystomops pustulosus]